MSIGVTNMTEKTNIEGIKKTWDKVAESYEGKALAGPDYQACLKVILETLDFVENKKICEVGCGSGTISSALAQKGGKVTLIDISPKAIAFAKNFYQKKKIKATFKIMDGMKMSFGNNSFDLVWNGGVLEHFDEVKQICLLRELYRVVKPGGRLIIMVPNLMDFPFMIAKLLLKFRKKWGFGYEKDISFWQLEKLTAKAGIKNFKIFAFDPVVGWWFFPYGKEITEKLGLNKLNFHQKNNFFGHFLVLCVEKPQLFK